MLRPLSAYVMTVFEAVVDQDADALARLVGEAPDLNAQFEGGRRALHEAAIRGHLELVQFVTGRRRRPVALRLRS